MLGAQRQPQLRRPHPAGRPRQLPRVAAAGRRLRAGRTDDDRHHDRAARHDRDGSRSICGTSGRPSTRFRRRCSSAGQRRHVPRQYADVFEGDERWQGAARCPRAAVRVGRRLDLRPQADVPRGDDDGAGAAADIAGARVLAVLGDSVTTDHISPAGRSRWTARPAYLIAQGVEPADFNSYGARRGNHEVMMRGTFANIRLRNQLAPGTEGGWTTYQPGGELMTIYDASMEYQTGCPAHGHRGQGVRIGVLTRLGGQGHVLLGVKAVIAETFERIHRSNLVNMGVLPLQFKLGDTAASLKITGAESFVLPVLPRAPKPRGDVLVVATEADGSTREFTVTVRIDTPEELVAFRHGGILPYGPAARRKIVGGPAGRQARPPHQAGHIPTVEVSLQQRRRDDEHAG